MTAEDTKANGPDSTIQSPIVAVNSIPVDLTKPLPVVDAKSGRKVEPKPVPIKIIEVKPGPGREPEPKLEPKKDTKPKTLACGKSVKRQGLRARWKPEKSVKYAFFKGRDPLRLVLKLRDDVCATAANGHLVVSSDRTLLAVVDAISTRAPGAQVTRRFRHDDKNLEAARRKGEKNIGQRLADMRQYYWIQLNKADDMTPLLSALVQLDVVENVYSPSLPVAPPGDILQPETPNFSDQLGYWGAAPVGLDIDYAVDVVGAFNGGTGNMAAIADIEYGWNTNHEDLSLQPNMLYTLGAAGTGFSPFGNDHGTAVAGIIVADPDEPGIQGIAPAATFLAVPVKADATSNADTAQAILDVAVINPTRRLGARGIVLLEMQTNGPNNALNSIGLLPVEYDQDEFDAIKLATSNGIIVIEAAANGSQDLDLLNGNNGHPTYNRFNPRLRHSGAILVGGATSGAPHKSNGSSNIGVRVDTYAWGQNIFSLGYGSQRVDGFPDGDFDPNQRYRRNFNGTSGASAIVAGVAAIFESVHFITHESLHTVRNIDATALRLLLRTTGTPSVDPATDRIGRMADLAEQLPLLKMGPGLGSVFSGNEDDRMGTALAPIGDIDGDGIDDLIVGAEGGTGSVSLYSGATGDLIVRFSGNLGERFGAAVSAVEDIDGDGLQDVIVGAPGADRVTIYSTNSFLTLRTYLGDQNGADFGAAVASQGDIDGDGYPEILIGAPKYDHIVTDPKTNEDRVYNDGGRVYNYSTTETNQLNWIKSGHTNYGSVIVTGDVMFDDGKLDILVGAPNDPGFTGNSAGRVFLYRASGDLWNIYTGAENFAQFGSSIALVGDIDGDDTNDFVVGSPGESQGRGSISAYSGHSTTQLLFLMGQTTGARFGQSVAEFRDNDNDGIVHVLVGAPYEKDSSGDPSGAVFAISLDLVSSSVQAIYSGEAKGDRFGTTLTIVGDVNGDGKREFISGAPGSVRAGNSGGAAYLFLLPSVGYD